ncbi:hypothetical protein CORMATOL_00544 [Corynebacterium matruchotii ATCC 33806]|uniref:Uncharacterized protein n=1 Tax=Corynebacterium matruchotii ATCC 33806 TaxID=566549 RepID=C0E0P4_9CORY|nr:hypothetical protein CORMATOL_00544 [Corynebacterium matruchotii ATCC 33806]
MLQRFSTGRKSAHSELQLSKSATGEIFGNLLDRGHVAGIHSQNAA